MDDRRNPGTRANPIDADTILRTTEEVLRRHGPGKATVLDVARALGVSHGTVYRHFPSKAALREAVTRRWIDRSRDELTAAATDTKVAPPERLRRWLATLFAAKRAKAREEPEMQATYRLLVTEHSSVAVEHVAELIAELGEIITAGIQSGDFETADPAVTARAVFDATSRFHDPAHAGEWHTPGADDAFEAVTTLILRGLRAR